MSVPVLATKLFAPPRPSGSVVRSRLIARLDTALDPGIRLAMLSAPPGFGKTTLLTNWLAHLQEHHADPAIAWLTLDAGDNDVTRLLTHLLAALRGAGLDVVPELLSQPLSADGPAGLTAVLDALQQACARSPLRCVVLLLDDVHLLSDRATHEVLELLLTHLPSPLHPVISSRSDPPLPLALLRARGELLELRAADLRFTPGEAREFLADAMGVDLGPEAVALLTERTEGWVAGLKLAALSLRTITGRTESTAFIESFAGDDRFVLDFLADEVLARQPVVIRDFLLRTAVLDRLTGELCDAVTGREDGRRMLEQLERGNLFLVPLDRTRTWYRYHHLFADVLRSRLAAEGAEAVAELHRRAGVWSAAHGQTEDAVAHALAADDFPNAARLMEEALPGLLRARRDSLLLTWIRALPDSEVGRRPSLGLLSAWSLMMTGDLEAMESRLDDAEAALAAGDRGGARTRERLDTDDHRVAPAMVFVYRAALAQARGDVGGTARHARRALELAGPRDHRIRGAGGGLLGLATWAAGDVAGALGIFGDAVRDLRVAGNAVDALDATIVLADMWIAVGRPGRARQLYDDARRRIQGDVQPHLRALPDLHVGLAELDLELDDLDAARTHLETARGLAARGSITENRYRWFVVSALLRAATGDCEWAQSDLEEAGRLYRPGFYPQVRPIPALRARIAIAAGDLDSAAAWAARETPVDVSDEPEYLHEYEHLTLVELFLARRRAEAGSDDPEAVLGLLERLLAAATVAGRHGSIPQILALRALVHDALGDRRAAVTALQDSLTSMREPASRVRLYLEAGPAMRDLLRAVVAQGDLITASDSTATSSSARVPERRALAAARARPLLDRFAAADIAFVEGEQLPAPLSRREREVLRLLDSELTGPEIAARLFVSLNTLRTHTKHVFTKLGVTSRSAAVRTGHDLGLL